ncbi:sorting nexin-15 isoform X2 [Zalophus californianus]|uniref:Sorting nexin-15 isoform X2 n=1 Tax=Zalophus californianus TaxID=9704 RepID=A0A6J2BNV7_ZALCA|nr:sorting nexin-15 isoform X2 [Zalophus californianus]
MSKRWWSGSGTATSASCMGTWPTPTATSSAAWRSSRPSPAPRCLPHFQDKAAEAQGHRGAWPVSGRTRIPPQELVSALSKNSNCEPEVVSLSRGRFEASVIEERRKGAEDLLRFTVHIPALNNSPQLKEFFRGGEVTRPSDVCRDLHILPPPLIPTPPPEDTWLPQPLPTERRGLEELDVPDPPPSSPAQEALDLLFNCGSTEEASSSPAQGPLTEAELALFDPFSREEGAGPSPTHMGELAAVEAESERLDQEPWEPGGPEEEEHEEDRPAPAYLSQATELITQALRDEKAGAYPAALQGYRDGVHILLQGVPGDPSPARREGVKKKAAEYLKRAEEIFHLHLSQPPS